MDKYVTVQGDTFDVIALQFYGDELRAGELIAANPQHAGTVMFAAGVALQIPQLAEVAPSTLPPWRR